MLCDICNKIQATVHLTEIVDGQITELHLCEHCAKEKSSQMEQQFGLSDLLAGLVDFGKNIEDKEDLKLKCPNCKLSYREFKKIGRFGCSECYNTFSKYLEFLLKNIHGANQHVGKMPVCPPAIKQKEKAKIFIQDDSDKVDDLKARLQKAITREDFEEAAKLRDKIKEFELKSKPKKEK